MELSQAATGARQNQENLRHRRRATIRDSHNSRSLRPVCRAAVDVSPNRRSYRAKLLSAASTYSRTPDGTPDGRQKPGAYNGTDQRSLRPKLIRFVYYAQDNATGIHRYMRMAVQIRAPSSAHKETSISLAFGNVNYSHITSANPRKPQRASNVTINISGSHRYFTCVCD